MNNLQVCKEIFFEVKSDLNLVDKILEKLEEINQPWISIKDWNQCKLALVEGFTNAVRHAHKDLPKDTIISIKITLTKEQIIIKIWDYGKPFDLEEFINNYLQKKDPLSDGGRGLEILQKIATKFTYTRLENNQNCLLISKKLSI